MDTIILVVVGVLAVVATVVLTPLGYAAGGYFTGWILSHVFLFAGTWIVEGAAALGITLTLDMLPPLGAFLAFVGAFFRSSHSHKKDDKK